MDPLAAIFLSLAGQGARPGSTLVVNIAGLLAEVQAATKSIAHLTPQQARWMKIYWSVIQNSFTVTRGIVNLNNGGRLAQPAHRDRSVGALHLATGRRGPRIRCGKYSSRSRKRFALDSPKYLACDREEIAITPQCV